MTPYAAHIKALGLAHMRSVEATVRDMRGSAEALADCRKRQKDAQRTASLIALYGACGTCNTPYIGEDEPCIKCDPSTESQEG